MKIFQLLLFFGHFSFGLFFWPLFFLDTIFCLKNTRTSDTNNKLKIVFFSFFFRFGGQPTNVKTSIPIMSDDPAASNATPFRRHESDEEEKEEEEDEEPLFSSNANEAKKKSNTTKVLSTYGGSGLGVKNHFLHVALSASVLVLAVFLCLGLVYIPAMNPMESYALKREDKCFARSNSTCENYLRAEVYFWNVTNPMEFVNGVEAPKLEEVGPFVIKDGVSKKQNVTFSEDGSEVGFVETLYGQVEWGTESAWESEVWPRLSFFKYTFRFVLFFLRQILYELT